MARTIAAGATDHRIYLFDASTGEEKGRLTRRRILSLGIGFHAEQQVAVLFGVGRHHPSMGRRRANSRFPFQPGVRATGVVAASPDGRLLAYGDGRQICEIKAQASIRTVIQPGR